MDHFNMKWTGERGGFISRAADVESQYSFIQPSASFSFKDRLSFSVISEVPSSSAFLDPVIFRNNCIFRVIFPDRLRPIHIVLDS